jgi:hypothetical protein
LDEAAMPLFRTEASGGAHDRSGGVQTKLAANALARPRRRLADEFSLIPFGTTSIWSGGTPYSRTANSLTGSDTTIVFVISRDARRCKALSPGWRGCTSWR